MSLLLDALKQAALEKQQQDLLEANRSLIDDELMSGSESAPEENQSNIHQENKALLLEGIELSLDDVTVVENDENHFDTSDTQHLVSTKNDTMIAEPSLEDKYQNLATVLPDVKEDIYGKVEIFKPNDHANTNSSNTEVQRNNTEAQERFDAPDHEQASQEQDVAELIAVSNKVHKNNRYRFYAMYTALSVLVAAALSYEYLSLSGLDNTQTEGLSAESLNAVSSADIEAVVKNSIAISKTVDDPVFIQTENDSNTTEKTSLDDPKIIWDKPESSASTTTPKTENVITNRPVEPSPIENKSSNKPKENSEPTQLANGKEQPQIAADSNREEQPVNGILVQRQNVITISDRLAKAYSDYQAGDLFSAEQNYLQVLVKSPIQKDAMLGLAAIYARENKPQQSLDYYQKVLTVDPNNSYAKAGLLSLQASAIENPKWLAELDELLFKNPDSAHLHFLKANVFAVRNQWQAAQESYFNAWEKSPKNPDYVFNLAVSLDQLQQTKQALSFYQKAYSLVQTSPHNIDVSVLKNRIEQLEQGR